MNLEAAIVFVVILAGLGFFMLVLPLAVVLVRTPAVWRRKKGTAALLLGLVALTGLLFTVFLVGLAQITFGAAR